MYPQLLQLHIFWHLFGTLTGKLQKGCNRHITSDLQFMILDIFLYNIAVIGGHIYGYTHLVIQN